MKNESIIFSINNVPSKDSDFESIKEKLSSLGVELEIHSKDDTFLTITIKNDKFEKATKRNAGRKSSVSKYSYIDILKLRTKYDTLEDVAASICMPYATFYRHWAKLKKSWLFEELNQDRINDIDYLESMQSHDGNFYF